jgi:hypothetical protein
MKISIYLTALSLLLFIGCQELDYNPLSEPSSGNFYSNETELTIAVNDLYRFSFIQNDKEEYSDDFLYRANPNAVISGTMNSGDPDAQKLWTDAYKIITRANTIIASLDRAAGNTSAAALASFEAQARLARAYQYSRLITHFGDVPLITKPITLAESYSFKRSDKNLVLEFIFEDLDFAAANLPASYSLSAIQRFTSGTALAVKARTALYMGKYDIAKAAAKAVITSNAYSLYPSYRDLFLKLGEQCKENILTVVRDQANGIVSDGFIAPDHIARNAGGFAAKFPTWELVDSYECTDGLPVDKSPLYNPQKPFANRDPRLAQTIVPFSSIWLGYIYQPHPDSLKVRRISDNAMVTNNDNRANAINASFSGFLWKKGIDQSWADRKLEDNDYKIIRYAEMFLIYAEADIEMNTIDATTLLYLNTVRARAYGKAVGQTTQYPAVTTTNQAQLRTILRRERRVEFAFEGLRYMDLIRWKIAEKALNKPGVGIPDPVPANAIHKAKFPFAGAPVIDADGIPDYTPYIATGAAKNFTTRKFDATRQYLWPIPAIERTVNPNLTQNPNY